MIYAQQRSDEPEIQTTFHEPEIQRLPPYSSPRLPPYSSPRLPPYSSPRLPPYTFHVASTTQDTCGNHREKAGNFREKAGNFREKAGNYRDDGYNSESNQFKGRRVKPMLGGKERDAYAGLLEVAKRTALARFRNLLETAPVTSCQIGIGAGIALLSLVGVLPLRPLLFHSRLVLDGGQVWRIPSSFLVLSTSFWGVLRGCVGLYYYQAPMEQFFTRGLPDIPGSFPNSPDGANQKGSLKFGKLSAQFIRVMATLASAIVFGELFLSSDVGISLNGPWLHVYPYSLFPLLDQAMRWTWAMIADDSHSVVVGGGLFTLEPIHIPLLMLAMDGFESGSDCFKGLAAACIACHFLDVKRWDGTNALTYFQKTAYNIFQMIKKSI